MTSRRLSWWWAPTRPFNLGVFRIVAFATLLFWVDPSLVVHFGQYPPELRFVPGSLSRWFAWWPSSAGLSAAVYAAFVPLCVLAIVGLWTRWTALGAAVCGFHLLTVPQMFGAVNHYHHVVWCAFILAGSPCGDALSIDAWRRRRRGEPAPGPSWAYTAPLRGVALLLGVVYLFMGLRQARAWGAIGFDGERLATAVHRKWVQIGDWRPLWAIDEHPWALSTIAMGVVAFTLGFLVLLSAGRTPRRVAIAAGVAFHVMVLLVLNIRMSWTLVAPYAALVDWERRWPGAATPAGGVTPVARRRWVGSVAVSAVLLTGTFGKGLSNKVDWPCSSHPAFTTLEPRLDLLRLRVTDRSGAVYEVDHSVLAPHSRLERAYELFSRVLREGSAVQLRALWALCARLEPRLGDAVRVEFVRQTVDVDLPVERRVLARSVVYVLNLGSAE